jgi:hypothetical protein
MAALPDSRHPTEPVSQAERLVADSTSLTRPLGGRRIRVTHGDRPRGGES